MKTMQDFFQRQIDQARDAIRMFESGELTSGDYFVPFKDRTPAIIQNYQRIIEDLEEILRKLDAEG
jgi:hypothetical protein